MKVQSGRAPRRGLTTVAVLICLVVILLISGVLLKIGVAHRDRVRAQERSLQAEWLAQAGLERARGSAGLERRLYRRDLGARTPRSRPDRDLRRRARKAALVSIKSRKTPWRPRTAADQGPGRFPPRSPPPGTAFRADAGRARFAQDWRLAMIRCSRFLTIRTGRGPRRASPPRAGFTLIELLVVIAIIAVSDRSLAAGGPVGPRGGPALAVLQQPDADGAGPAKL